MQPADLTDEHKGTDLEAQRKIDRTAREERRKLKRAELVAASKEAAIKADTVEKDEAPKGRSA